jgi:hypothetical protein
MPRLVLVKRPPRPPACFGNAGLPVFVAPRTSPSGRRELGAPKHLADGSIVRNVSADEQPSPTAGPPGASTAGARADEAASRELGTSRPRGSLTLARIVVAALSLLLLFGSLTHIGPAVRAGLHEGTRGYWVVTSRVCSKKACVWSGKFVLRSGHVQVASIQYEGTLPAGIHTGMRVPVLYPGGSLVFPITGSDLWISLTVAILAALLGLYWATHLWVAGYLRERRDSTHLAAPVG